MEFDKNVRVETYDEKYLSRRLSGGGERKQVDLR